MNGVLYILLLPPDLYRPCRSDVSDNRNFRRGSTARTARTWSSRLYLRRCPQLHSFRAAPGSCARCYTLQTRSLLDVSYCRFTSRICNTGGGCLFNVHLSGLLRMSRNHALTTKSERSVSLILEQGHLKFHGSRNARSFMTL